MASTSLPLATAAAVATLFAAPAGAAPNDQPTTPPTTAPPAPAPVQPGAETPSSPETTKPDPNKPSQPGVTNPPPSQPGVTNPPPSQPGVNTPDPAMPNPPKDPKLAQPSQPGVTTPRVAPLPVPGSKPDQPAQPAITPDTPQDQQKPVQPGTQQAPGTQAKPGDENAQARQPETLAQPQQQPRWQAPRLEAAPPAPVVEMSGPHQEIGANVDGGNLLPGYAANTHHFNNESGYVGTIGYRTPAGAGEAGVSVEYVDANTVKVTTYTGGVGLADNKTISVFDTTQANLAKAAVENWIKEQPGGAAALEAAAQVKLPLQPGDLAPQTVEVGGVTTQWGGSLQY
ncbi:hypothetical protein [Nocardia sp. NPDC049149]|uniref:hypothetical protein n=1 Tax=Nocardia sp. NPDC049149 TaxID=3364315 RepID=UPI00371BE5F1